MPYEIFLAFRNLRTRRKRRLARVTALVAVIGISVGVAAMIVVLSLANGFRDEMRDKILQGTAHINVLRTDGKPIENHQRVVSQISELEQVAYASGTTYEGAVLAGPAGAAYAVMRGVDRQTVAAHAELARLTTGGSVESIFHAYEGELREILLGDELAARVGLKVGDVAEIIPATASEASGQPVRRLARVGGIFRSGLFEYDSTWIFLSLDTATAFAGRINQVSVISVQVRDIYQVQTATRLIQQELGSDFKTIDWQEANRPLFAALELERKMGLVVIALLIFIAALNITSSLILVVTERRRDIAILSAMGATRRSIMSIFVAEGAVIGVAGSVIGLITGILACWIGNRYRLVSLPADVYSISHVPFNVEALDVSLAVLVALVFSLLATLYPARAAATALPANVLRDAA